MKMKRKTKTLLLVLLAVLQIFTLLPLARLNAEAAIEEPTLPLVEEEVTLQIALPQDATIEDMATNWYTQHLIETTGINLEFDVLPSADALQKVEILIQGGGDLPDVFMGFGFDDAALLNYGKQKAIIPLNEYYDNFAYYIKQGMEAANNPTMLNQITSADGNIYTVPLYQEQLSNNVSGRLYINKAWLEALDLEMPTTTDEFAEVLKAFRDNDPNGNGEADEIPLVGGTGWNQNPVNNLMNAFVYNDFNQRYIVEDDQVSFAFTTEGWKNGLAYARQLVDEKLLSTLSFTQDHAQLKSTLENADIGIVGAFTAGTFGGLFNLTSSDRGWDFDLVQPLAGPDGTQFAAYFPNVPTDKFVITRNCENPEAAFKLADFMWKPEESVMSRFGEPEVDWRAPAEDEDAQTQYPDVHPEVSRINILTWGSVQNKAWRTLPPANLPYSVMDTEMKDPNLPDHSMNKAGYMDYIPEEYVTKIVLAEDDMRDYADLNTTINTYVNESLARFATGDLDIENDWDGYLAELEAMGLLQYQEIVQRAYNNAEGIE